MVSSLQVLSETAQRRIPELSLLLAYNKRRAVMIVDPDSPERLKRMYPCKSGEPSKRMVVVLP
jgi:hypothetical protein